MNFEEYYNIFWSFHAVSETLEGEIGKGRTYPQPQETEQTTSSRVKVQGLRG